MQHNAKDGAPKVMRHCDLPLTGRVVVHRIITDLAVMDVTPEGLVLREVAPGHTVDEVVGLTDAPLIVDEALKASAGKED